MKREFDTTPDQEVGLQHATDVYNATDGPRNHAMDQQSLPEKDKTPYVPFTAHDYFEYILDRTFSSYAVQAIKADNEAYMEKYAKADKADRAKLKAAVDAVRVKPKSEAEAEGELVGGK